MVPAWTANWLWSFPIIAVTLMFHSAAIVILAISLVRGGRHVERQPWPVRRVVMLCVVAIGLVGWLLAILHGVEAGIWAGAFLWLGALGSPADDTPYSLDSFTSRGASGLILARHWRLMGALEAANGALLLGISTAFLFTVIASVTTLLTRIVHDRRHVPH